MQRWRCFAIALALSAFLLTGCTPPRLHQSTRANARAHEYKPVLLELPPPWGETAREYSGMAVRNQSLILLPQYPERSQHQLPVVSGLDPSPEHAEDLMQVSSMRLDDDDLPHNISGFEGYEAIGLDGNDVFVTIEAEESRGMMGYLVHGRLSADEQSIVLDPSSRLELPPRAQIANLSDEAIVMLGSGKLLTIYEANGSRVVPKPTAYLFEMRDSKIVKTADIPMPAVEFRITDCTPADASGKFWCLNCMYPPDEPALDPARDRLIPAGGPGRSHAAAWRAGNRMVERLIQLQFDGFRVKTTTEPPIYLKLQPNGKMRNWESLALTRNGFYLATDKYPQTLFGFVKY